MNTFWLIWNERGHAPTHKHGSAMEARTEAERLARLNPGHEFHVLELKATCTWSACQWREPDDDIPF